MSLFSRRVDKQLEAYQRELVDTHYKEVENRYRQIRGWRHDYRNHIQVLKAFAAKGDMDAIRAYLDELDTDLNTVDTVVKTGNPMADAILNSKISLARSRNIPTQVDAHIPVKLKMSELDLCCIVGNLFDNAMEASMALPEEKRLIRSLLAEGKAVRLRSGKLASLKKAGYVRGPIEIKRDGFGFIRDPEGDVFIPAKQMHGAMQGEEVLAWAGKVSRKGREGRIERVLSPLPYRAVASYALDKKGRPYAMLENAPETGRKVALPKEAKRMAKKGDVVVLAITRRAEDGKLAEGRIEEVYEILRKGSEHARATAAQTLGEVRHAMRIDYFDDKELIAEQARQYQQQR